jgi:RHS repeat-associated protein
MLMQQTRFGLSYILTFFLLSLCLFEGKSLLLGNAYIGSPGTIDPNDSVPIPYFASGDETKIDGDPLTDFPEIRSFELNKGVSQGSACAPHILYTLTIVVSYSLEPDDGLYVHGVEIKNDTASTLADQEGITLFLSSNEEFIFRFTNLGNVDDDSHATITSMSLHNYSDFSEHECSNTGRTTGEGCNRDIINIDSAGYIFKLLTAPGINWTPQSYRSHVQTRSEPTSEIRAVSNEPDPELFKTSSLDLVLNEIDESEAEVIRDANQDLLQIKTKIELIDVVTTDSYSYELRTYPISAVGPKVGDTYQVTGSPTFVHRAENPDQDASGDHIIFTKTAGSNSSSYEFTYDYANEAWEVETDKFKSEVTTSWDAAQTKKTTVYELKDPVTGGIYYSTQRVNEITTWGEPLIQRTINFGEANEKSTDYTYNNNPTHDAYQKVTSITDDNGDTILIAYDSHGRPVTEHRGYMNSPANTNLSDGWRHEYDYVPIPGTGDTGEEKPDHHRRLITYYQGLEVARTFYVYTPGEQREIVCVNVGALWNDAQNLVTRTTYVTSGTFEHRPINVEHPDGTLTHFEYSENAGIETIIQEIGKPNGTMNDVIDGTRTVTVTGTSGELLSTTVYDISSGVMLDQVTYSNFDAEMRPGTVTYIDGSNESYVYNCCGLESYTDRTGVITTYFKHEPTSVEWETTLGIKTKYKYDDLGNLEEISREGTDGTIHLLKTMSYDMNAKLESETNALNGPTTYYDAPHPTYGRIRTTTFPDLSVREETYFKNGELFEVDGDATFGTRYFHDIEQDGGIWRLYSQVQKEDDSGNYPEWTKNYKDMVGRNYLVTHSDPNYNYPRSTSYFNNMGQLVRYEDPDGVTTLYDYNDIGERSTTATDLNANDTIDYSGTDRITYTTRDVYSSGTGGNPLGKDAIRTQTWVYDQDNTSSTKLISETWQSTDGLKTLNRVFKDQNTPVDTLTEKTYTPNPSSATGWKITITHPDATKSEQVYAQGRLESSSTYDSATSPNLLTHTTYLYDPHGRQWKVTDSRNGTTTYAYNNADLVVSVTTPSADGVGSVQVTTTDYDTSLRPIKLTYPDGGELHTQYYKNGLVKKTYGSRAYPVEYTYDSQGRMKTMTTWKDYAGNTGKATTTWNYDLYRGWLTSKDYPYSYDGTAGTEGPSYTYTDAGRLSTRVWQRGVTTSYGYGPDGNQTYISYSDSTPTQNFIYDRQGRLTQWYDSIGGLTDYAYNDAGLVLSEENGWSIQDSYDVFRSYDDELRLSQLQLKRYGSALKTIDYSYDILTGRLSQVSSDGKTVDYSYEPNSSLVNQLDFGVGTMTSIKEYDYLNRLTSITNQTGGASQSVSSTYVYNDANQRTSATAADGSYWIYNYDDRGQVLSGKRYWADGTLVAGQQFEYGFDDIGNRTNTSQGGDDQGANMQTSTYTTNYQNELTSLTVPSYEEVQGVANSTATVTVNGFSAYRKDDYFRYELPVSNLSSGAYSSVTVVSTVGAASDTSSGYIYTPRTNQTLMHDSDGNVLSDGRWTYTWNAENRLIAMQGIYVTGTTPESHRLEFKYDGKGRRIEKTLYRYNSSTSSYSDLVETWTYIYDGWNLIGEIRKAPFYDGIRRSYVWGPDLSGSMQGAGGVGGLLMVTDHTGASDEHHYVGYDGNGNVAVLVDSGAGTISGRYEYGPFGEPLRASGETITGENPFRFSTKFTDRESGFLYYGFRYYNPETGRWLNRDPLEEQGGINLYLFALNNAVNSFDYLGLAVGLTSIDATLARALATGNPELLRLLLAGGCLTPRQEQLINAALKVINRLHHIFGKPRHQLDPLLRAFQNNQWNAFNAVRQATEVALRERGHVDGVFKGVTVVVNNIPIVVQGRVKDGVVLISTFWRRSNNVAY